MTRKASFAVIVLAALILGVPGLAQATSIGFTTSGVFQDPGKESPLASVTLAGSSFYWGNPVSSSTQSSLKFFDNSATVDVDPGESEWLVLGDLKFHNGRIAVDSGATDVDLSLTITFSTLVTVPNFALPLDIENTLNRPSNPDTVTLSLPAPFSFSEGGFTYTLEVLGFRHDQVDGQCCDGYGSWTSLTVDEDCDISARIKGRITVVESPVPEPGTMLLLGSGLLGVVWRRRRA